MNFKKLYISIAKQLRILAHKSSPRWGVLLIDIFLVLNAFLVAYLIRFNFSFHFGNYNILPQFCLVALLALLSFLITGSYKGIVRHTGLNDVIKVTYSSFLLAVFLFLIVFLSRKLHVFSFLNIPLSVIGINFLTTIFLLISSRVIYKSFHRKVLLYLKSPTKVLIHGAHSGKEVFDAILASNEPVYEVEALIDDRPEYIHKSIHGKTVYPPSAVSPSFINKHKVEAVIISKPDAKPLELLNIAKVYLDLGLKVKTIPFINEWIDSERININQIKELNIDDLLNRNPIEIDNPIVEKEIKDKVILITGAAGSIGSEISRQVLSFQPKLILLLDQAESALYDLQQEFVSQSLNNYKCIVGDIRDKHMMHIYFDEYKPDIIYHAAAYKHVPLMEENPYEAVKVNVAGTKIIMDLAVKYKVPKFVMVSTDKAVNPTNVMGATKRAAELYAACLQRKTSDTKFVITRFGNVLGSNGSVIQLFKKQLKAGGPLTVTHQEITRYFMTIPEACRLVLEAGTMGKGGEIFVFDMGQPVRIFDLAVKMIQLSGLRYPDDVDIKITGLRPGEKLYEEVLGKDEGDMPTHHEKVKIARPHVVKCEVVMDKIQNLTKFQELTNFEIVKILKELIPEFVSNNSPYQDLDV